ncbi:hypothetical protein [Cellvibrio sp.]
MIKFPKYISENGSMCHINLGVDVDHYGDGPEATKFSNERIKKISWMCDADVVELDFSKSANKIYAYPTQDMQYMVVLLIGMPEWDSQNCVFYDEKGTEVFRPSLPELKMWSKPEISKSDFRFGAVNWTEREDYLEFWVDRIYEKRLDDFFEIRFFNYKTLTWDEENWLRQRY